MTALLQLEQVSAQYGAMTAVHPLTLAIDWGGWHALIGPNGAGKSTLLHVIAGGRPAAGGRILFDGRDITCQAPHRRARHGIARTFQHPGIATALTVADNMRLALPGDRRACRDAAIGDALDRVGLAAHRRQYAGQLSYGQQRLLELGMAVAARPRLLLLDEPSAGLDTAGITHLTTILAALPAQTAVVLVDHHLPLVWAIADTVTVLHHGKHLATATPDAVQADERVRDAYLSPPTSIRYTPRTSHRNRPRRPVLLQVHGLRAGYHGADVLHGIDLDVRRGAVHAVVGRNGAGKTTLLDTIAGLHPARAGRIRLAGTDLHPRAGRPAAPGRIGIVPQGRRLFSQLTTAEHLRLAARRQPPNPPWTLDTVLDLMPSLRDGLDRPPAQLSGGQQQFLALARALLAGPQLLLLDEPTEGLAPALITGLQQVLVQLADGGQTVLLAEQNLSFVRATSTSVTVLADGQVTDTVAVDALDAPATLHRLHRQLGVTTVQPPAPAEASTVDDNRGCDPSAGRCGTRR